MKFDDIKGWYDWEETYRSIVSRYPGGILVEVGTFLGRSLCHLGQMVKESKKPFQVVGVDWCVGSGVENGVNNHAEAVQEGFGSFAGTLHRNVMDCGLQDIVSLIVASSEQACRLFCDDSLTMVFLDARHDYDSLKRDIEVWLPKIKPGGTIGGDDVGVPGEHQAIWPDVKKVLDEMLPGWKYSPHDAWIYSKVVQ